MKLRNCLALLCGIALSLSLTACERFGLIKTKELLGVWTSEPSQTEWGMCTFEISFEPNGVFGFKMRSISGGEPLSRTGKYALKKGRLVSDVLNNGQAVPISIKGDTLTISIQGESETRFKRK